MNKKIVLWTLVFILLVSSTLALGVRPVKTHIDFVPEYEGSFKVVNNDHQYLSVVVYAEGELADYITFEESELEIEPDEEFKLVKFVMKITDELPPGLVKGRIIIEEKISNVEISGSYVSANLKMTHKVEVQVPYPDKYIEAKIDLEEKDEGVDVVTTVKNVGTKDLASVKPTIEVFAGDQKISSYKNDPAAVKMLEEQNFITYVNKKALGDGLYTIVNRISFDDNSLELAKTFTIGKPSLNVENLQKFFAEKKISELPIEVRSEWNGLIEDVHLELFVFEDNIKVLETKTTSFDISPLGKKTVTSFFDATDLSLGEYELQVLINYGNQSSVEKHDIKIITQDEFNDLTGGWKSNILSYIIIGLMIIIIVMLGGFFYFMFRGKKPTQKPTKKKRKKKTRKKNEAKPATARKEAPEPVSQASPPESAEPENPAPLSESSDESNNQN